MTRRALILGLAGALLIGAGGQYVNKYVPGVMGLVRGHLPVSIFGMLILGTMVLNPLLAKVRPSWRLRGGEAAVVFAMVLCACAITDAGLMRHFPRSLAFPVQQNRTHPGWQHADILRQTPPALLAGGGEYSDEVIGAYFTGKGQKSPALRDIPWRAWWRPLLVWGTLVALLFVAVVALAVVVHPQWADKERIRYPLAEIGSAVLQQDETGRPTLLRNRFFWVGLAALLALRALNGLNLWFPGSINVPLNFDLTAIKAQFPSLMQVPGAEHLANVTLYPVCIGLTYLLASDIGFSLGIANLASVCVLYLLLTFGVSTAGGPMTGGVIEWLNFGSFLGVFALVVYTGRHYYWMTARAALSLGPAPGTAREGVWAFRVALICVAGGVALLAAQGLPWPIGLLALLSTLMMFLVLARLNAETGTFFFAPAWQIPAALTGLCGLVALGPKVLIILGLLMYMTTADPFECLMPFAGNGLNVAARSGARVERMGLAIVVALLVTLAVAIPTALWADYSRGVETRRGSDTTNIYDAAVDVSVRLGLAGQLEAVQRYSTMDRLRALRPERGFLPAAGIGLALVVGCGFLRLRFSRWPLHPVFIVLIGSTGLIGKFCASFLTGWAIKVAITKLGGGGKYREIKPLMLGVIIGDLLGSFLIMLVNWGYYLATGLAGHNSLWLPW